MSIPQGAPIQAIEASLPMLAVPKDRLTWPRLSVGLLALPIGLFLAFFFFYPAVNLLLFSVLTQNAQGVVGRPFTAAHFAHFFGPGLYMKVFWTTLRISLVTSLAAAVLAYPVAIVILRSRPLVTRAVNLIVIAPLLVSVVVRAYGWQLILANGPAGVINKILLGLGLIDSPLSLLYSDTAVVIGSLHVFFPMMVLPLVATLGKVDRNLEDAARMLGASSLRVFLRVTFPLSLPGLLLGFALVFTLTTGSFVTPAILGGTNTMMLGNLIEQQIFVVYDWPFGATIAVVMVGVVLAANALSARLLESRHIRMREAA